MLKLLARIPPLLLVVIGFILGLALAGALLAPRALAIKPEDGAQEIPATSRIRLSFSRPMNQASVEAGFSTDPPQSGQFSWEGRELVFTPDAPWPSNTEVEVRLKAGALGRFPLPLLVSKSWHFRVGTPRVLYLWPASGRANLYLIDPGSESGAIQLTFHEAGVLDYTLSGDGTLVAFSLNTENGGQNLQTLDLISGEEKFIHACSAEVRCSNPALSPDGRWLAFVEQSLNVGSGGRSMPQGSQIRVLSVPDAEMVIAASPTDHTVRDPAWSPQGWLTYYDESLKATALLTFDPNAAPSPFTYVPNSLGAAGSWSPDGTRLVYPEIYFVPAQGDEEQGQSDTAYYSHLYQTDVTSGGTQDISPGDALQVEDASPVFSPDGTRLAFARKYLDPERWSPGRQLWLLDLSGVGSTELTSEPNYTFSAISWDPDSQRLAYMRRASSDLALGPEIWWMDLDTMESDLLVPGGYLPQWIP
ncbi:MAG: Ig-like domain-containing protein [Anaerolineales bacterium]|jgi:Tol biopolymer transport system component